MGIGWKSYSYEVGGQGSYDNGEIPDKMIACNDECFWNCSSSMYIDEGESALFYFKTLSQYLPVGYHEILKISYSSQILCPPSRLQGGHY
jgi:hypothetical protein